MILAFLFGGEHKRKKGVMLHARYPDRYKANTDIMHELDEMQEKFNDKEKSDPDKKRELIKKLADEITDRDLEFLRKGRERNPDSKKPLMDPWLSFVIHFGLNGNSTGVPELDEMYKDIRAFITRPDAEVSQKLTETLKIYIRKHPGVKINLKA